MLMNREVFSAQSSAIRPRAKIASRLKNRILCPRYFLCGPDSHCSATGFGEFEPTWAAKGAASLFLLVAIAIYWTAQQKAQATHRRLSSSSVEAVPRSNFRWIAAALTAITGWDYFNKSRPYLRDDA